MSSPIFNESGLKLLKEFEGCRLKAYRDIGGILTIGFGHTGVDVHEDMEINQAMADSLLLKDINNFCKGVNNLLKVSCTDNQYSAMVCFAYNVGLENFKRSTLLNCVNKNNAIGAAGEFGRWNKVKGVISAGLSRRRESERQLFTA